MYTVRTREERVVQKRFSVAAFPKQFAKTLFEQFLIVEEPVLNRVLGCNARQYAVREVKTVEYMDTFWVKKRNFKRIVKKAEGKEAMRTRNRLGDYKERRGVDILAHKHHKGEAKHVSYGALQVILCDVAAHDERAPNFVPLI
jgi:hypothetical protein